MSELERKADAGNAAARKELHQAVLDRDGHRCWDCEAYTTEVHHVLSRRYSGAWSCQNMLTLCPVCHRLDNKGGGAHTHEVRKRHLTELRDKFGYEYSGLWLQALEESNG